jgi:hypothetical protein
MDSPTWFTEGGSPSPNTSLGCYCQAKLFGQLIEFIIIIIIIIFITKSKVYRVMK